MSQLPTTAPGNTDTVFPPGRQLRVACLSYSEVLAQSVSVIAPSTIPAAVLGLIFAKAGNATCLSFVLGMLGLVLVSHNINQFARRSASPGSLYSYLIKGLTPTAGILGGWALLFGYALTGMSTLCGLALSANVILRQLLGIELPIVVLFAIGSLASFCIAFRDIQLSAKTMLLFEGASLLLVLFLGLVIWATKGFKLDTAQLTLSGSTPSGALSGVGLVVFGFSGFESATALGDEAKAPLRTIPRAVVQSVVLTGAFFTVMAFVIVFGFDKQPALLATSEAPLNVLAASVGWSELGALLNIGILLSFFSCTLASINSAARILFTMAQHGLIADALGEAHAVNRTPHVAVAVTALFTCLAPCALHIAGISVFDCQGHFGTLCSFGFIVVYILISLAAPHYLASIGKLDRRAIANSIGGVVFMALPVIGTIGIPGSQVLPLASGSSRILIGVFAAYMLAGFGWLLLQRARRPKLISEMQSSIDTVHWKFAHGASQIVPSIGSPSDPTPPPVGYSI